MALSAGPSIIGQYSTYHYDYQIIAEYCYISNKLALWKLENRRESTQNTAVELLTLINTHQ